MLYNCINYGEWKIHLLICIGSCDCVVLDMLEGLDAQAETVEAVKHNIFSGQNSGFTFTNYNSKESIVVVGPLTDWSEFFNTFNHELRHLVDNICYYYGITDEETPAYMTGELTKKIITL